jgi:hypothetical protein
MTSKVEGIGDSVVKSEEIMMKTAIWGVLKEDGSPSTWLGLTQNPNQTERFLL